MNKIEQNDDRRIDVKFYENRELQVDIENKLLRLTHNLISSVENRPCRFEVVKDDLIRLSTIYKNLRG